MNSNASDPTLTDFALILWSRKKAILAGTLSVWLAALIYVALATPVYEIRSVLELGWGVDYLGQMQTVEKYPDTIARISAENQRWHNCDQDPRLAEVNQYMRGHSTRHIEIVVHATETEAGLKLANEIAQQTIARHQAIQNRLLAVEASTVKELKAVLQSNDPVQLSTPAISRPAELTFEEFPALKPSQTIFDALAAHQRIEHIVRHSPTQIIANPYVSDQPARPKSTIILSFSAIGGMLFGIFLALIIEFIRGIRREITT